MDTRVFRFDSARSADLIVDAVYLGGRDGHAGDDPIAPLMRCGNQGGFRTVGTKGDTKYVVLYSSQSDPDWPDRLDMFTGLFTYYGDNKKPGSLLHETSPGGNRLLARIYGRLHDSPSQRYGIPPAFVFTRAGTYGSRAVQFRGLAVPGAHGLSATDDLIAVWRSRSGRRFQNYKAIFTILDVPFVARPWLDDLQNGDFLSSDCPEAWRKWVEKGTYEPMIAEPTIRIRTKEEQFPSNELEGQILRVIFEYFKNNPTAFELCATEITRLQNPESYIIDEITRRSVDGGRDAIGRYRLGPKEDPVTLDFALEAKCYRPKLPGQSDPANPVGIKETSRLISRLRHRQFGILITTSYIGKQAYEEIRNDGHPVILLCGRDIARLLIDNGYDSVKAVEDWLTTFPR